MREAPSAEALRKFRQATSAMAWLPDEVEVPSEWAEAGFTALGRTRLSEHDGAQRVWDALVDPEGTRVVWLPVDPAGAVASATVMSPLPDGGSVTTIDGSKKPGGRWAFLVEPHHPPTRVFQAWAADSSAGVMLATHGDLVDRVGPPVSVAGRNEWRQAVRQTQARRLDVFAAMKHAIRHQHVVRIGGMACYVAVVLGWPVLRQVLDPATSHEPLFGIPWFLQLVLFAFIPSLLERVYLVLATRRLARTGPIPEVAPPDCPGASTRA